MTDIEYQNLKTELDKLSAIVAVSDDELYKIREKIYNIKTTLEKEDFNRYLSQTPEQWVNTVKEILDKYKNETRTANELWMVEIDGCSKLRTDKGKYTWTSYNRALKGICDYLFYHDYNLEHAIACNKIDILPAVQSLIDSGYIKIIQVV